MKHLSLLYTAAVFASALSAQNGPSAVGDFTMERVITLASASAPNQPSFPAPVLAALQAGQIELHQVFTYTSATGILEQLAFVVPANSPVPFPDPSAAPVGDHYLIQVDASSVNASPGSVVLIGHVISNDIPTPFGYNTGAGITLSFGYRSTGSSVRFGPVMESVSPLYNLYTDTGVGSLSLTPTPAKCTPATLKGTYMFRLGGGIQTTPTSSPYWESGTLTSDGAGNIVVSDSGNVAGAAFSGRTFPITYTLNANCQGSFNWNGASMDIQVSRDGRNINMAFTKPSSVSANGSGQIQ